jgi:hypothetical protein
VIAKRNTIGIISIILRSRPRGATILSTSSTREQPAFARLLTSRRMGEDFMSRFKTFLLTGAAIASLPTVQRARHPAATQATDATGQADDRV